LICASKCIFGYDESKFRGAVKNFSISGVLARIRLKLSNSSIRGTPAAYSYGDSLPYPIAGMPAKPNRLIQLQSKYFFIEDEQRQRIEYLLVMPVTLQLNKFRPGFCLICECAVLGFIRVQFDFNFSLIQQMQNPIGRQ